MVDFSSSYVGGPQKYVNIKNNQIPITYKWSCWSPYDWGYNPCINMYVFTIQDFKLPGRNGPPQSLPHSEMHCFFLAPLPG